MLLSTVVPRYASARSYMSEVGTCRKARTKREAKHLYFSIEEGKELWKELKLLRLDKQKLKLIDTKLELKGQQINLWKIQFHSAERAVKKQETRIINLNLKVTDLTKENKTLTDKNYKLNQDVVKYKGERYQFLVWGVVGGFVLTVLVAGAIGIAVVTAK
jgi:septal ring factor EnvC (AmiA/AmiB activator)